MSDDASRVSTSERYATTAEWSEAESIAPKYGCTWCAFWEPIDAPVIQTLMIDENKVCDTIAMHGLCRRRSPLIAPELADELGDGLAAVWPMTSYRDWCGDFEGGPQDVKCFGDPRT